ncbi:polysaccharide biosynthesis/export family protein [Jannaschia sp. S6380]|uniref:polysaccharide biosynthesis/export family protein n=1 Tax=Jannaschia sp. S6380 TaxID=2926408 RepID=UPI001FF11AC7|nr:polysaccharide biosynthesis/export family protein [Jannaschia sp. S6380]MCK0168477.1 polysaccharide biosynthesis/export family protein [Jannaschia sp. S6380]
MRSDCGLFMSDTFHVSNLVSIAARRLVAMILLFAAMLVGPGPALAQDGYALNAGDRIAVRVLAWNSLELEFELYEGLGGTYRIDGDGTVALPLLGAVTAGGLDVATLAREVGQRYQRRLGLAETPSATVEIVEYRPVYVLGDVARPGRYEYELGLNATRALALAGGIYRPDEATGTGEAIRAVGRIEELAERLARERMRAARLRAEMAEGDAFDRPDLPPHPSGETASQALYSHEASLFDSRRSQMASALASIGETEALLQTEITALEEKRAGIGRQLELVRESVGNLEALRERGLARSPTLITLQQTLIDLEARELDTETGIFRARQQLSELDRDEGDLRANRRVQVLRDLQEAEGEVARLETQLATTRNLLSATAALLAEPEGEESVRLDFTILRGDGGERIAATPATPLRPLDVLEVEAVTVAD